MNGMRCLNEDGLPPPAAVAAERFDRCNLTEVEFENAVAHGGAGTIRFKRIVTRMDIDGACNFMDVSVIPPGSSVGEHTHGRTEEEYYLILEGAGLMLLNGVLFRVRAGDLVRNPPGGTHALINDGDVALRMFVFELRVPE